LLHGSAKAAEAAGKEQDPALRHLVYDCGFALGRAASGEPNTMGNTIYAAFADAEHAEKAAGALLDHGVRPEDLSVVRANSGEATVTTGQGVPTPVPGAIGGTAGVVDTDYQGLDYGNAAQRTSLDPHPDAVDASGDVEASAKQGISTTTAADAGAGAVKGTAWGAGLGALAALASLVVPGVGLVVGGGALAAGLGAVAATAGAGALAGAVTGYLKDQGVDEHVARHYESTIGAGGALLAVTLPSGGIDEARAQEVLGKYGASNVNSYATRGYVA
jgi:uncharacterized membrane protein